MDGTKSPAQIAAARLARSRTNVEWSRRTRHETAEVLRTSAKAIAESRDSLARSRELMREWQTEQK
jgi:acyl-CoA reductase-like NAD-dependent aldehyde dehydrogenase